LAVVLVFFSSLLPGAWAKPKFKVLATIPGGLWSGLTLDAKGNLYGVTNAGGEYGYGSIFEVTRDRRGNWEALTLHSFNGTDGGLPRGPLVFDSKGNLYGAASGGGANKMGTVFELSPGSGGWAFTVLYSFPGGYGCPDGCGPVAGLARDREGNLFGAALGGAYDQGVIFELAPGSSGWTYSVLYNFGSRPQDGWEPLDTLVLDVKGNVYGTTYRGGPYGGGTVFELSPMGLAGWKERLLDGFCRGGLPCTDGERPTAGVILEGSSDLYGTTVQGGSATCGETNCGTVFKLTRSGGGWKESVLYDFAKPGDGYAPVSGLAPGPGDALYGTTALGGTGSCNGGLGCGVVYEMAPHAGGKWAYTVLHKFNGNDGLTPEGRLILDTRANLYGTALTVVYEITP